MDSKSLMKDIKKSPLFGSNERHGMDFDDLDDYCQKSFMFPKRISVRKGCIIDKLTFIYDNLTCGHGGNGGAESNFNLQQDEHIIRVTGNFSRFANTYVIESLRFYTDKGQDMAFGTPRPGSNYFDYQAAKGNAICGLFGRSEQYLENIGFYEKPVDMSGMMPGKNPLDFKGFGK